MFLWVPHHPDNVGLPRRLPAAIRPYDGRVGPTDLQPGDQFVVVPPDAQDAVLDTVASIAGLRVVQSLEVGVERLVDRLPAAVQLCNAAGVHDTQVAEYVLAAVLAGLRRLPDYTRQQLRHEWRPLRATSLSGKRLVLLGYGSIARAVERRLGAFDVNIVRVARSARDGVMPVERLTDAVSGADVVLVLVPLTRTTRGLIDAHVIDAMEGALLVNAARGQVVDTEALLRALRDGRLSAVLDVTDPEPLPDGHPLWDAPNCLVTPHVASDTAQLLIAGYRLVAEQVTRVASGRPLLNLVDREKLAVERPHPSRKEQP